MNVGSKHESAFNSMNTGYRRFSKLGQCKAERE